MELDDQSLSKGCHSMESRKQKKEYHSPEVLEELELEVRAGSQDIFPDFDLEISEDSFD